MPQSGLMLPPRSVVQFVNDAHRDRGAEAGAIALVVEVHPDAYDVEMIEPYGWGQLVELIPATDLSLVRPPPSRERPVPHEFHSVADVETALRKKPPRHGPGRSQLFVDAVKACVGLGATGERLLRDAYRTATFEQKDTIVLGLTYFPTQAVATLLKGAARGGTGTPTDDALRLAAIWALAKLHRPQDAQFLLTLLEDRSLNVRDHTLRMCVHHGAAVPPETTVQFLSRLSKRRTLGRESSAPTEFMVLVTLFARSATEDPNLLSRFATLVKRTWPRLIHVERQWLATYWPEAIPGQVARLQAMPTQRVEELIHSWPGQRRFQANQMIY